MPGHSQEHRVTIGYGRKVLLTTSATVHSIEILNGGTFYHIEVNKMLYSVCKVNCDISEGPYFLHLQRGN